MENKVKIKVISTSPEFKVLHISGNSGDVLSKHQVVQGALLLVRKGNIVYAEGNKKQKLTSGECWNIPAKVVHGVTCADDSDFFVVLSNSTKMEFEK